MYKSFILTTHYYILKSVESDSQFAIFSITGKVDARRQISNLVVDIKILYRNIKSARFIFCRRSSNNLADRLAKMARENSYNLL